MDTEALITARASELIDAGSPQGKAYRTAREEALDFCRHTADGDGFVFTCNRRAGHKGWHGQTVKLRDGYETTNWGDDGLAIHASRDEKRKKEGSRRDYPPYEGVRRASSESVARAGGDRGPRPLDLYAGGDRLPLRRRDDVLGGLHDAGGRRRRPRLLLHARASAASGRDATVVAMATTATVQTARENAQHVSHLAGIPDVLRHDGEEQLVSATAAKVLPVVDWILSLDDEDDQKGLEARRTVTLTEIIGRFQDALA